MTRDELVQKLEFTQEQVISVKLYFILKKDENWEVKLADIKDDSNESIEALCMQYKEEIKDKILNNEEMDVLDLSAADERKNAMYYYDLDEKPEEFNLMDQILHINETQEYPKFNFDHDSLDDLKGYVIIMGNQTHKIALYKHHYGIFLYKRQHYMLRRADVERLEQLNEDIIKLDSSFQYIQCDNMYIVCNIDSMEKRLGIHDIVRKEALNSIQEIEHVGILDDVEVLKDNIGDITFARKLTKIAKNSPVLGKVSNERIIEFSKSFPSVKGKLKYSQDGKKICLTTKSSQILFIKLLSDSFLTSKLTQNYYESKAKDKVDQPEETV